MRLIDADKIGLTDFEIIMCQGDYREAFKMLLDKINNQAIVFDVDKVIEELEKLADESYKAYCIAFNSDDRAEYDTYTNAIEIVKQGGVADDVCEWKSVRDGEFIQNPHTKRLFSNEPSMKNVYCNTCGKKIKIVGD